MTENWLSDRIAFTWDSVSGFGPVAGLDAGLRKARGQFAFATGCDLPFLNAGVVERLSSWLTAKAAGERDTRRRSRSSPMDSSSRSTQFTTGRRWANPAGRRWKMESEGFMLLCNSCISIVCLWSCCGPSIPISSPSLISTPARNWRGPRLSGRRGGPDIGSGIAL